MMGCVRGKTSDAGDSCISSHTQSETLETMTFPASGSRRLSRLINLSRAHVWSGTTCTSGTTSAAFCFLPYMTDAARERDRVEWMNGFSSKDQGHLGALVHGLRVEVSIADNWQNGTGSKRHPKRKER